MAANLTKQDVISRALSGFNNTPDCAFISLAIVCALYGLSAATVWRKVKAGNMPRPIKISVRRTAWRVGDIRADLESKVMI